MIGISKQTLENSVRQVVKGKLIDTGAQLVSEEQMELARLRAELARGQDGARHIRKSDGVLCAGVNVKYAWIEWHKNCWPITQQCEVLNVSASGYFEHQRRKNSVRAMTPRMRLRDAARLVHIKGEHGWP